jgi:Transposase.
MYYENEGEVFLHEIVTKSKISVNHYEPEMKCQSMEYLHKQPIQKKKFKSQLSAGKIMVTVVWDSNAVVHVDLLKCRITINS